MLIRPNLLSMLNLDSLTFDTTGWSPRNESEVRISWHNANGDKLRKLFQHSTPKMPPLFELHELRTYFRGQATAAEGGIISVDSLHIRGLDLVRSILKLPYGDQINYVGIVIIPYRDFSFNLKFQAFNNSDSIDRTAIVQQKLSGDSNNTVSAGTASDPYDPSLTNSMSRLESEDERWDAECPTHPLSRLRASIAQLLPTIQTTRDLKNSVPFRGPNS